MVAFRRPTSLKDILVHSELKTPDLVKGLWWGVVMGGVGFVNPLSRGRILRVTFTGRSYVINFKMDCNTDHVYLFIILQ